MDFTALLSPEVLHNLGTLSPYAVLILIILLLVWMLTKKEKRIDQLMQVNNELIKINTDNLTMLDKAINRLERITDFLQFKKQSEDE